MLVAHLYSSGRRCRGITLVGGLYSSGRMARRITLLGRRYSKPAAPDTPDKRKAPKGPIDTAFDTASIDTAQCLLTAHLLPSSSMTADAPLPCLHHAAQPLPEGTYRPLAG